MVLESKASFYLDEMEEKKQHSKPHDKDIKQQKFSHLWRPQYSYQCTAFLYGTFGLIFIILGAVIFEQSNAIVEIRKRYDDVCPAGQTCQIELAIPEDMDAPVYFYYELTNYYQNYRRYVKSLDFKQLRGEPARKNQLDDCAPLITYGDAYNGPNTTLDNLVVYPCGLIASSFFRDSFTACYNDGGTCNTLTNTEWSKDIMWSTEVPDRFKTRPLPSSATMESPRGFTLPPVTDPDFVVWMRPASHPTFGKLYRKISTTDLKAGAVLNVTINSVVPTSEFKGEKWIVLSTMTEFGGKSDFLGIAYLVMGCILIVMGMIFAHFYYRDRQKSAPAAQS